MRPKKQSQLAARRRGGLHRADGDRQVGHSPMSARHNLTRRRPETLLGPRKPGHALS
jgi:hypothetical protein